ncbi:hypothetical protein ACRE_046110 [Hapsidospora chrysogenum ATCC 11550]|uniref:DUF3669 domain-containing protein n=1 Tax=Hapsidospora chrysogenum (strain ATCC 11550 / CBS 779.69 / DSM 880 / IAM 14645 / JCM 23072 / IMI 49137) TaxID=857340 RepID=A0A086T5I3_HAPC1|nr:hypothetical protein ACRE_046110 [Hapsidospora chrysogenum ATCC 11550]
MEVFSNIHQDTFERIGQGFCGTVWATTRGGSTCIKREDGGPGRSLNNEYQVQTLINAWMADGTLAGGPSVPSCHHLLEKDDPAWHTSRILDRFPEGYEPCNAMISEKIQPIAEQGRRELIYRYCPPEIQQQILDDRKNQHCLVRPYLGRRRRHAQSNSRCRFFSLRNYSLHMDQVEELSLPFFEYARFMARALALLNWELRIDGNDVEFVLAAPRPGQHLGWESTHIGRHAMWMLDFDCCRPVMESDEGVEQIVRAFWRNDPYCPRPGEMGVDEHLWEAFAEEYRQVGLEVARSRGAADVEEGQKLERLVNRVLERIPETKGVYVKGY